MERLPDTTPVLVGAGLVSQREEDPLEAQEPLELMVAAARAAERDSGGAGLLREVEAVYVPRGRWRYRDPGRRIASRVGAGGARSVLARVGILQEQLIGDACERISRGDLDVALVVGGEAGHRLLRSRITGQEVTDSQQDSEPDEVWRAPEAIMTEAEISAGLGNAAPAYYAVIDSAYRSRRGIGLADHRRAIAELYSGFSRIAEQNPEAWRRSFVAADDIQDGPMIAFPYTKLHTTDWSVDQASALLLSSARKAREWGVPADRWVFPLASCVSNHMTALSERPTPDDCLGAEVAARRALDHAGITAHALDLVDLYSCFPVAVLTHAEAVGIGPDRLPTLTGGMRFAGGPFNNYVLHTIAQLARALRRGEGEVGLVSSVSGVLTKHGFSLWGRSPCAGYVFEDVTDTVSRGTARRPVRSDYRGPGRIAGYTVLYESGDPTCGVALVDTPGGERAIARTEDRQTVVEMTEREFCGMDVHVHDGSLVPGLRVGGAD